MTAMMMTFYLYCLSLRESGRWWVVGIFAGGAYGFMAATWGGYVFVINMVGLHAGLVALLRHSSKLHKAYSLFYVVGTFLATRVPVISMTPLKSLEQLMPLLVFLALQLFELIEIYRVKNNIPKEEVSEICTWSRNVDSTLCHILTLFREVVPPPRLETYQSKNIVNEFQGHTFHYL